MNIQILANIAKFLERVSVTGSEAYAWTEAHQYIQSEMAKAAKSQLSKDE